MRLARHSALVLLVAGGVVSRSALADSWPIARHDAGRTGASSGSVPLASASIKWRAYVGGRPTDATVRFDGSSRAVVSVGGRFIAKNVVTQLPLWTSELLGAGRVVEISDLDGDGSNEVVVQTAAQAHVLDGGTGAVKWSSPSDAIQIMGAVRVRDVDGDGLPDVYLDNGIGAKPGTDLVAVYSFATGNAVELWSLSVDIAPQSLNSGTDTLVDLNGDGESEVILPSWTNVRVARGSDGTTLTTLEPVAPVGNPYVQASALAADLDGAGDLEVLMVQSQAGAYNQVIPGVSAYQVDVPSGQSVFLWSADTGSVDSEIAANGNLASDLDGDGVSEVVFSYRSTTTGGDWLTEVRSGSTGALLDEFPDARFEGAADLDGEPGSELVVATPSGLQVHSFASGSLVQVGATLSGVRALGLSDATLHNAGPLEQKLATVVGQEGQTVLYVGVPTVAGAPLGPVGAFDEIRGIVVSGGSLSQVGNYTPLVGAVSGALQADFATRPYEQLALGTTEGLVVVLNRDLQPTNGLIWIDGVPLGSFVGGGQTPAPLSDSDALGPFVVLPGTAVGTVVADARLASWIIPPLPRWWQDDLSSPSVLLLEGEKQVVGVEDHKLSSRSTMGGQLTGQVALPEGSIWGTPLPLQAGADTLVGIDWRVDGMQIQQTAVDFGSGSVAWTAPPIAFGGFFGSSVGDLDSDGVDEWFSLFGSLVSRSALDGSSSNHGSFPALGYSMPLVGSFNGEAPGLLLQAGGKGATLLHSDYSLAWDSTAPEAVNTMAGTRTSCGAGTRFVTPSVDSPYLRAYDGATGALVAQRAYAGGQAFPTIEAAIASGERPGSLSHANSVADLAGTGPAVLAGSSDGFLYVVDACTLDIRWAADIGRSLGEPVIADVDADGEDEIMVSATDGFVYGLDVPCFPAPVVTCDQDEGAAAIYVAAGATVTLGWEGVPGAEGYEVALISPDDRPLWSPEYRAVDGTTAEISLVGALAGRPYRVSVRAVGVDGAGLEAFSKPLVIEDETPPGLSVDAEGGASPSLSFSATDDVALDHFVVRVTPDGGAERVIDDATLSGMSDNGFVSWAPAEDLWGSDVQLNVDVVDSGSLRTSAAIFAHVTDDGIVVMDGEAPSIDHEHGVGESEVIAPSGSAGCSVPRGSVPVNSPTFLLAGLLGLAALRRRSRS